MFQKIKFLATIPHFYREVFDTCSNDGSPILPEVYRFLLSHCHLSPAQVENISNIVGTSHNYVNRTNLYKTLALIAWAQQGKTLSDKLFENCVTKGMYIRLYEMVKIYYLTFLFKKVVLIVMWKIFFTQHLQIMTNSLILFLRFLRFSSI